MSWKNTASGMNRRRAALALTVAAAALIGAGHAQAQTVITPDTPPTPPIQLDGSAGTITVESGATARIIPSYQIGGFGGAVDGTATIYSVNNTLSTAPTSASANGGAVLAQSINVQAGGTLVIAGTQSIGSGPYLVTNNMINDAGNLVVEGVYQFSMDGSNSVLGNLTLESGATVHVGEIYQGNAYGGSALTLGADTNISLGTNTLLYMYEPGFTSTAGGMLSGTTTSTLFLNAGTLVINGANTAASPFVGTLQLGAGANFVVGDAAHPGAVFGDPGNTNGSTETLTITRASGNASTLAGYGTIYATVINNGIVTPGGTAGTLGTLTVSQYTQNASGILNIEVAPTGASRLNVLGTANLGGTLALKLDAGTYGNQVIPIITANAIHGSFASIEVSGNVAAGLAITPTSYDVVTEVTSSVEVFGHLVEADRANYRQFVNTVTDVSGAANARAKASLGNGIDLWLLPDAALSTISRDGYGYKTSSQGVTGGIEHVFDGNAVIGIAGSYASQVLKTDADMTRSKANIYDVAVYGGYNTDNARIDATLFYNSYDAKVARNLGASGTITSAPGGKTYGGSLRLSHTLLNQMLTPFLQVTYAHVVQGAVAEQGTNLLALDVDRIAHGYAIGELGAKLRLPDDATRTVRPELTLAVDYDFSHQTGEYVSAQFANLSGSSFAFGWRGDNTTAGVAALALRSNISAQWQVFGKVEGRFTQSASAGAVTVGASLHF